MGATAERFVRFSTLIYKIDGAAAYFDHIWRFGKSNRYDWLFHSYLTSSYQFLQIHHGRLKSWRQLAVRFPALTIANPAVAAVTSMGQEQFFSIIVSSRRENLWVTANGSCYKSFLFYSFSPNHLPCLFTSLSYSVTEFHGHNIGCSVC